MPKKRYKYRQIAKTAFEILCLCALCMVLSMLPSVAFAEYVLADAANITVEYNGAPVPGTAASDADVVVKLAYETMPHMTRAGKYKIVPTVVGGEDCYELILQNGTLTVSATDLPKMGNAGVLSWCIRRLCLREFLCS